MLNQIKVLELASVLAGPSVGQFFAELGADVIKVENLRTGGDVTRTWKGKGEDTDDRSAYFCAVNWGKRSIALDFSTNEGQGVLRKLVSQTDIVIASYKPGDAEKLQANYETLKQYNPAVIYGQITGYGMGNDRVGYDAVIQAEAGFMSMNGERGGRSLKMPVALVDVLAAHHLKEGLLLSLIKRMQTGQGSFVEVSLLEAAISSLVNQATNWLMAGTLPGKVGSTHPNIAPYGDTFVAADGLEILLAVGNDKQFQDLCRILGIFDLAYSAHYINNQARVRNRESLRDVLQTRIGDRLGKGLVEELHRNKIPAGIIQNLRQVFEMPEAQALVLNAGELWGIRNYVGVSPDVRRELSPPPHFGEHSLSIMAEVN